MADRFQIGVSITADDSKFRAAMAADEKAIANLSKSAAAASPKVNDSGISSLAVNIGAASAQFEGIAGPAGVAVSVITGVGAAAITAGTALFSMAKNASDFGSEIWDANQKTGLTTDALQAIRFAASQGGISFDQAVSPISKFAKMLGEAKSGSKEAAITMQMLGVTSFDMQTALGQAYQTILKYPDGVDQMAASQKAFGKSGPETIAFLKEFGGDLPGLIEKSKSLGLVIDKSLIQAGDKFGDTLALLDLQVKTSAANFALEFAPGITEGMNIVSEILTENQDTFKAWGVAVEKEIKGTVDEIKARGGDWEAAGEVLAERLGEGIGAGLKVTGSILGDQLGKMINGVVSGKDEDILSQTFGNLKRGFDKTFWAPILGQDWFQKEWGPDITIANNSTAAIKQTTDAVKDLGNATKSAPSLADKMKFEQAAASAKKMAEQTKNVATMIADMGAKISTFGEESEVASVKQNLLKQGFTDFNSALAKSAINFAAYLDKLKQEKKAHDEVNAKLKEATKHLADVKAQANFDLKFTNATELNKFDDWVQRNTGSFRTLKGEIDATRVTLEKLAFARGATDRDNAITSFADSVKGAVDELDPSQLAKLSKFQQEIVKLVEPLHLDKADLGAISSTDFAAQLEAKITAFEGSLNKTQAMAAGIVGDPAEINKELQKKLGTITTYYYNDIQNFLSNIKKAAGDKFINIFADSSDFENAFNFVDLFNASWKNVETSGITNLDTALSNLGIAVKDLQPAKTDLEKLNDLFADPTITAGINARAAALGMTADKLKELMTNAAIEKVTGKIDYSGTYVKPPKSDMGQAKQPGFMAGLFGNQDDKDLQTFTSTADKMKAVYADLRHTAGEAIKSMIDVGGELLDQWILTGHASGQAVAQMTASIISGLAVQAGVKAIFELAEGFAAAANPFTAWEAPLHFAAAKTYGIVAGVAVGTGLAIGAAGGLSPDKNSQGTASSGGSGSSGSGSSNSFLSNSPTGQQTDFLRQSQTDTHNTKRDALQAQAINNLNNTVQDLHNKISSMKEGEVLVRGINQKPGLIGEKAVSDFKKNSTLKGQMGRTLGLK